MNAMYKGIIGLVLIAGIVWYYATNMTFVKPKAEDIEFRTYPLQDTIVMGVTNTIEVLNKGDVPGGNVHVFWSHLAGCLDIRYTQQLKYDVLPKGSGCVNDYLEVGVQMGSADTIVMRKIPVVNPSEGILSRIEKR